jgi:hypothetical protein
MAEADCSRCVGLCCVALAFDRSEHFAFDKAAGVPCSHLGGDDRCRIHDDRAVRGFGGCIRYDCGGAGARVVERTGASWRDGAASADVVFEAFRVEREVTAARELLETARGLPLPAEEESRRAALASALGPATWPELAPRVGTFVKALRRHLPVRAR